MTPEQFAYWLQGFSELGDKSPTQEQWDMINEHLQTVFFKVTPPFKEYPTEPIEPIEPRREADAPPFSEEFIATCGEQTSDQAFCASTDLIC